MKKLFFLVLAIVAAGFWSCGGSSGGGANPAFTGDCAPLGTPDTTAAFKTRLDKFAMKRCYAKQGWEHDAEPRTSQNVHDTFIKIYYSPALFKWMDKGQRQGAVPDGAIAIKEEYAAQTDPASRIQFWSVMIHDSKLWWDGWYWAVVGVEVGAAAHPASASAASGCADPDNFCSAVGPTALNCIGCHASASYTVPGTSTYSSPDFIKKGAAASGSSETTSSGAAASMSAHASLSNWAALVMLPQPQAAPQPPSGF